MDALEVARWVTAVLFVAVALVGMRLWQRQQSPAAGWVAAAFTTMAGAILLGRLPGEALGGVGEVVRVVTVVAIVAFPYLLYRFSEALRPGADRLRTALTAFAVAVLAVSAVAAPLLPRAGEPQPGWRGPFIVLVLVYWTVFAALVAVRLWRAGAGQPTPARRRMRLLGAAALTLNAALLLAGSTEGSPAAALVTQIAAGSSAVLFAVGFSPPAPLRALWRRPEGRVLREAERGLMAANSGAEIAMGLLPPISRLLGGAAAGLYAADGRLLGALGEPPAPPDGVREGPLPGVRFVDELLVLQFEHGSVVVRTGPYTPFFGADEVELAEGLASLVDLAMARVDLLDRERRAWAELERANDELKTLLYGLSHDLRNPLLTMLGFVELLGQGHGGELDDEGRMFVDRITRSAQYMDALIRDLLELSRVGRVHTETEEVDLTSLVQEVVEEVKQTHSGLEVVTRDVGRVVMSPVRARQLFTNLLQNAARHGQKDDLRVTVSGEPGGDGSLTVSVADNGVGVPAEYRERLFGMFERLEGGATEGTGIGLAICKRIMENLGGTIFLADVEVGADLRLIFPASAHCVHAVMERNA
jgi:signal transduction histidine kinase